MSARSAAGPRPAASGRAARGVDEVPDRARLADRAGARRADAGAVQLPAGARQAHRLLHEPEPEQLRGRPSIRSERTGRRGGRRRLRARLPAAAPATARSPPGSPRSPAGSGPGRANEAPSLARHATRAGELGQGRAAGHPEHQAGSRLRGGDGDRWPRRPLPVRLHPRPGGTAGRARRGRHALAAADPHRRHDHRLRLERRNELAPDRPRPADRAAARPVLVGLFATSPTTFAGQATRATAAFDHITLGGPLARGCMAAAGGVARPRASASVRATSTPRLAAARSAAQADHCSSPARVTSRPPLRTPAPTPRRTRCCSASW